MKRQNNSWIDDEKHRLESSGYAFSASKSLTDGTVIQVSLKLGTNVIPLGSIVKHDASQAWRDAVALAAYHAGESRGVETKSAPA